MQSPYIFNRALVTQHRNRAAMQCAFPGDGGQDFLWHAAQELLLETLEDMQQAFPLAVDLGCHTGGLAGLLNGRFGIQQLISCDAAPAMLALAPHPKCLVDEEFLPFAHASIDLLVSVGSLHWVNDLPGCLTQIQRILKPRGLMVAMVVGGRTLHELSHALYVAMEETMGGISPRMSPMLDGNDASSLLQRAGFVMPVVHSELLQVHYAHPMHLLADLRAMGQTNALAERSHKALTRTTMQRMYDIYAAQYPDGEGGVIASFELLTLVGWKS